MKRNMLINNSVTESVTENVTESVTENVTENVTESVTESVTENVTENRIPTILRLIEENPHISTLELARQLSVTRMTIHRDLEQLKSSGRLTRIGPDRGGYWQVKEE